MMPHSYPTEFTRVRVDSAGRVVVPADLREKLGIGAGDDLILSADKQGIHLLTFAQAVQAAQEALAPYRIPGVSVVDELIREREEEARREYGE
jgi:AbrB family looped-hinge helix DNA binding protein